MVTRTEIHGWTVLAVHRTPFQSFTPSAYPVSAILSEPHVMVLQRLYVGHTGDSGAIMACTAGDLEFLLRLTTDHKPNRPDEKERIERAGGTVDEKRNRVVSTPKKETNRVTMLNMSRQGLPPVMSA